MENVNEQFMSLSGKSQQLSVDLYKVIHLHPKIDEFMKHQFLHLISRLYSNSNELLDSESNIERLCQLKQMLAETTHMNNLLLMCFQLGMLNSDICIDFGQKLEFIKTDLKTNVSIQDDLVRKDFRLDFDDDDIDIDIDISDI